MKKIILGLTLLASLNSFANDCTTLAGDAVKTLGNLNGQENVKPEEIKQGRTRETLGMKITDYMVTTVEGTTFKVKIAPDLEGNCIVLAVGAQGFIR